MPAEDVAAIVKGDEPNRFDGTSLNVTGLLVAVYVSDVLADNVPDALPKMICTVRAPSDAPLIRVGETKVTVEDDTESGVTRELPTRTCVSDEFPVEKFEPDSVIVVAPVLVTELGVMEEMEGAAKYVMS